MTHDTIPSAAADDLLAALSQHLHGDGDTPTAGGRLIASAAEAAASAWRTRALAAEAEVRRLTDALRFYANPDVYKPHPHGVGFDSPDLSFVAQAALADKDEDTPPQAADTCATDGCTNPPVIRLDDRRLCRDCYATHDFGDDA